MTVQFKVFAATELRVVITGKGLEQMRHLSNGKKRACII